MPWTEIFAVFVVSHLTGDYLLQTQWQAEHKHGGLGHDPIRRRALIAHVATYGLAFVPALIWLATDIGGWVAVAAAAIVIPHLIQDDGRVVLAYLRGVKRTNAGPADFIFIAVDQTFHVLALFALALAVST
jgi:Protein of unknown function (DUF3307)